MATWSQFAADVPELAAFAADRLGQGVAYLATIRADGPPRAHPVTPIIGEGRLFLFMEPTSPKGRDLRRDPRFALHSLVIDSAGSGGEVYVRGRATPTDDPADRDAAMRSANYTPQNRYVLFELSVDGVMSTVYRDGTPVRQRWGEP
jgi:hypothetical protein